MKLLGQETAALDEYTAWLRSRFGGRLRRVRLFGSRARGEGSEESDLDVLVVVDGLTGAEARELSREAGDALTRHRVLLSPLALSADHYRQLLERERRLALEIEREGIPL